MDLMGGLGPSSGHMCNLLFDAEKVVEGVWFYSRGK